MKKTLGLGILAALTVAVPLTAWAASGGFSSRTDVQNSLWTNHAVSTSSTAFHRVAALSGLNVCAINQVTATLSVQTHGAPAVFQIRVDGGGLMQPGSIRVVPVGPHEAFSFTWVQGVSTFENNDHHSFELEWRSPSGQKATLEKGDLNLIYQIGTHSC
jgi:hypothetical protein